jgi:hypothetical protein
LSGEGGSLAREFGGSCSRVDLACFHGKTFWRVYLAGQFGSFTQWILKQERHMLLSKEKNEMYYGESVDCNIIM